MLFYGWVRKQKLLIYFDLHCDDLFAALSPADTLVGNSVTGGLVEDTFRLQPEKDQISNMLV